MKNQIENFQELTDLSTKSSKRHPTKVILNLYQPIDAAVHRNVHFWCSAQNLKGFLLKILLFHISLIFFFKYLIKGGAAKTLSMSEILSSER